MSRLLPPDIAWSYTLAGSLTPGRPSDTGNIHRLVVTNPEPPPDLNLPTLSPYPDDAGDADALILRREAATPTRVLQTMAGASVIEFHTHGFIANDVDETSYLVLSPELGRQYALTAPDIAKVKLQAAPLVILGACHAAMSSRSLEGGMGLPEAFLRSGARAVIASPDTIQDRSAYVFFAAVRNRVLAGIDPARAVRDERVNRLKLMPEDSWVSGVVVFE